jgi:ABC-type cobalamin/Fe3+-siderophores transport system ATPase subunit
MTSLALPSLEVQGFRCFQDLRIEKLGRINLIVGKNNIGKSSLLEAIQVYAAKDIPGCLWQILRAHDEDMRMSRTPLLEEPLSSIKYLFFDRKDITGPTDPIKIGPIDDQDRQLQISLDFYTSTVDEEGRRTFQILPPEEYSGVENPLLRFSVSLGKTFSASYSLDPALDSRFLYTEANGMKVVSVGANGLDMQKIAQLWDKVALTDHEQEVLKALRIAAPGTEAISTIGTVPKNPEKVVECTTIIKVEGISEPIPIRNLGNGMQRLLGIVLSLVSAQNGILLIDEVENGLYFTVQEDLWQLIFQVACQLNVQVFATTHSWDCISAFQGAIQDEESQESLLIRLEYKEDNIVATIFDEQDLAIIIRDRIEVR